MVGIGIALMAIGALGTVSLGAGLATASTGGTLELATGLALEPRTAALVAAAAAASATLSFVLGLVVVSKARGRRASASRLDQQAMEAERDARARLLDMRLKQLQEEVELLEARHGARIPAPPGVAVDGTTDRLLVVVPETGDASELSRRLAEGQRNRTASA